MPEQRTPFGSPVYRYQEAAAGDGRIAHADDPRLGEHLAKNHGGQSMVWHEIVSDRVHLDVHVAHPTEKQPYYLLMTSGMSARPMNVPADMPDRDQWSHAELCMLLPPHWAPTQEAFRDERVYWPVRLLKSLGRLPHDFGSWLGWGHSIPNGDPAMPYAPGTLLSGAVLVPPYLLGESMFVVSGEPVIHVFQVLPVTAAEMDVKLREGIDGLLGRLEETFEMPYGPIDPLRPSAA